VSDLRYRYVALPDVWPGKQRPVGHRRQQSRFKIRWTDVEKDLAREISHLGGKDVTLAVDSKNPGDFRQDGMLRADARPGPAVILSFTDRNGIRLQFPCDTYSWWQDNVSAIARALEALRMVDRYGVTQGDKQYVGFKALPASTTPNAMTPETAAEELAKHSPFPAYLIISEPTVRAEAIKTAKRKSHPDAGGDEEAFKRVIEAAVVLDATGGK
jgi:hypothetical protein